MTINEISKKFSLSKDTLRYWEKEKLIPTVKRDKNGYRVYDTKEQNWVFYIMVLRKAGMSIKKIKKVFQFIYEKLFNCRNTETFANCATKPAE